MKTLQRIFEYKGEVIEDPNPLLSESTIVRMLATTRPELVNGWASYKEMKDGKAVYTIETKLGGKG